MNLGRRDFDKNYKVMKRLVDNELTDKQKRYILMYYRDHMSIYDIADRCGVAPSTVSRTINRGKRRLDHVLKIIIGEM